MSLDQPHRLLNLFSQVLSNSGDGKETSITGLTEVDLVIASLSDVQLKTLLVRICDWSTNARTAYVAQRLLHVILRKIAPERIARVSDVKSTIEVLVPYLDRHLKQVDKLLQESFVVDYILREMDDVQADTIMS